MTVTTSREGIVGYVDIAGHPVDASGLSIRSGLLEAVSWAELERLERVIVRGLGGMHKSFEDGHTFVNTPAEPHLRDVLNAIEESLVSWIAAIEGVVLGTGAELALACRMRIMAPGARIGFPAVTRGVVPEAGATQRLPRLIGLAPALDLMTHANSLGADAALDMGLVHAIDKEPVFDAIMVNSEELSCRVPAQDLNPPQNDKVVIDAVRENIRANYPGQVAPLRVVDVVAMGLGLSFHEGLALEREAFLELQNSDQATALRHIDAVERSAEGSMRNNAVRPEAEFISVEDDNIIGNRILARYHEAADTLLIDGSTPWEVDEALVEFGFVLGPYAAQDLAGLDIAHTRRRAQDGIRDPARRYIPIADRMVELGKLGRKTGAGWYRYPGGGGRVDDPIVADLGIEEAYFAGINRIDYKEDEIKRRLLLAIINEAADALNEDNKLRARDVDLFSVLAFGFPRWRGGLMHYADSIGAKAIVSQLKKLCKEDPVAWKISPLLHRCAAAGTRIADEHLEH